MLLPSNLFSSRRTFGSYHLSWCGGYAKCLSRQSLQSRPSLWCSDFEETKCFFEKSFEFAVVTKEQCQYDYYLLNQVDAIQDKLFVQQN